MRRGHAPVRVSERVQAAGRRVVWRVADFRRSQGRAPPSSLGICQVCRRTPREAGATLDHYCQTRRVAE